MRLSRIRIDGFGSLQGMELRFGPAMNLVVGPNEAGKSTLQEAIVTGLFGLQSSQRSRGTVVDHAERWRPWQGGAFGLAIEFELEDGTHLRVERDLDSEGVRVLDLDSGADLSDRFQHNGAAGVDIGRQLLGISRDIYTNTACISRSEVMRLEDAGSIKEAIVALADSAHPDRTAQRVLDRLRQERAQRIGKPKGRTGRLHDLEGRLGELERQLTAARQARAAVEDLAQKRETVAALTDNELSIVQTLEAAVARLAKPRPTLSGEPLTSARRSRNWRRSEARSTLRRRTRRRARGGSTRPPSSRSRPFATCYPPSTSRTPRRRRSTYVARRPPRMFAGSPSDILG
ncbi:MAG: hypothetical protein E6I88_05800 [Chloroflexi bacterium]|nr:MAG: hypothetical protein E6I88_05800 [Chloroflexota bacterium]